MVQTIVRTGLIALLLTATIGPNPVSVLRADNCNHDCRLRTEHCFLAGSSVHCWQWAEPVCTYCVGSDRCVNMNDGGGTCSPDIPNFVNYKVFDSCTPKCDIPLGGRAEGTCKGTEIEQGQASKTKCVN